MLAPNETYQVQVRFFFATADGRASLGGSSSVILVGATNTPPATLTELGPFLQEGVPFSDKNPKYSWFRRQYEFTAQTDDAGTLSVMIGVVVAGFEIYYIDSVRIKFTRSQAGAVQPVISSASIVGKRLTIQGSGFGPSPRVLINNVDRTDFVTMSSTDVIKLKGRLSDLVIGFGDKVVVVDDTTAAASAPFDLIVTN